MSSAHITLDNLQDTLERKHGITSLLVLAFSSPYGVKIWCRTCHTTFLCRLAKVNDNKVMCRCQKTRPRPVGRPPATEKPAQMASSPPLAPTTPPRRKLIPYAGYDPTENPVSVTSKLAKRQARATSPTN